MPKIRFSKEDLMAGKQLPAAWYVFKVVSVGEGPGKKDPTSTTYPVKVVVDEGPFTGTPVTNTFSEKFLYPMTQFISAFMSPGQQAKEAEDYDLDITVGKRVLGFAQYDPSTGFN